MKVTGQKAQVFIDNFDSSNIVIGTGSNTTAAKQKYFVISKGTGSTVPVAPGVFFMAPATGETQITLVTGDRLLRIDPERFCKTTASFEFAMGSVDVGDDCDPGATIPDGILTISGSLAGLFRYDDATGDFDIVTDVIVNRFLDIIEDNGVGVYTLHAKSDAQIYLLTLLNSGGGGGTIENWLFVPINITSMSLSLGNADPQSKELSFSKGEGSPIVYKVPVSA
jgi:hypothetical protein